MKRFLFPLIMIIAITLSTCIPAHAQVTLTRDAAVSFSDQYAGMIVSFVGTIDSVATDTSATFTFAGYQGESWYVNPIQYTKKLVSATDTPFVTIYIEGQLSDGNWTRIDTLGTKDSVETVQRSTADFNNLKCYQYRAIIKGEANGNGTPNPDDTSISLYLFLPRKDW